MSLIPAGHIPNSTGLPSRVKFEGVVFSENMVHLRYFSCDKVCDLLPGVCVCHVCGTEANLITPQSVGWDVTCTIYNITKKKKENCALAQSDSGPWGGLGSLFGISLEDFFIVYLFIFNFKKNFLNSI